MKQIGKVILDEDFDYHFLSVSEPAVTESKDVQCRADLIQDVIDRLVDKNFSREYLDDLEKLNKKYPIEFRTHNGVRIYS